MSSTRLTNVTLRLPKIVDGNAKAYNDQSAEPNGQGPVNPGRLNPPFLKIPGLRVTYEMIGMDMKANQGASIYLYLAALPAADAVVDGKPVEEWIQTQLATTFLAPVGGDQVSHSSRPAGRLENNQC